MSEIPYTATPITDVSVIKTLLGKSSQYQDFIYAYQGDTIELLERNFTLPDSLLPHGD